MGDVGTEEERRRGCTACRVDTEPAVSVEVEGEGRWTVLRKTGYAG